MDQALFLKQKISYHFYGATGIKFCVYDYMYLYIWRIPGRARASNEETYECRLCLNNEGMVSGEIRESIDCEINQSTFDRF